MPWKIIFLCWLVLYSAAVAQPDIEQQKNIARAFVRTALTDRQGYRLAERIMCYRSAIVRINKISAGYLLGKKDDAGFWRRFCQFAAGSCA